MIGTSVIELVMRIMARGKQHTMKISVSHLPPRMRGKAERWAKELEGSKILTLRKGNPLKDETYSVVSWRGDGHPSLPCSVKSSKTT